MSESFTSLLKGTPMKIIEIHEFETLESISKVQIGYHQLSALMILMSDNVSKSLTTDEIGGQIDIQMDETTDDHQIKRNFSLSLEFYGKKKEQ